MGPEETGELKRPPRLVGQLSLSPESSSSVELESAGVMLGASSESVALSDKRPPAALLAKLSEAEMLDDSNDSRLSFMEASILRVAAY
jgi:hypothetical protein